MAWNSSYIDGVGVYFMLSDNDSTTERLTDTERLLRKLSDLRGVPSDSKVVERVVEPEVVSEEKEGRVERRNSHGRSSGALNIDMMTRELVGTLANLGNSSEVARTFGVSISAAHNAKLGQSSPNNPLPELQSKLEKNLGRVRDKALDTIIESLDLIDTNKLEKEDARGLSAIASNLSKVVEKTLPKSSESNLRAQLIVYAPTQINESKFEVVEI